MAPSRTPALVLRKFEFGETSQVVHLLTRDSGRVHALAKGSLRPKSGFGGALDVLEAGVAAFYPKRSGLAILGSFERRTSWPGIRRGLERLQAAFHLLEVLHGVSREEHADPELFDLAVESLEGLEGAPRDRIPTLLLRFDLRVLAVLGLGPVLDACVSCGRGLAEERTPLLSPARGGALCAHCRDRDPLALSTTRGVLAALARLADPDPAATARLALTATDRRAARRLADALLTHLLERKLRAAR